MNAETRRQLIDQYRQGIAEVKAALNGATNAELDATPRDGGWTARQIAHHLADSETTSYIRLRRLLAENGPTLHGYDENEFAQRLMYDLPIEASLEVFRAVRTSSAEVLDQLNDDQWLRSGIHTESGNYTVESWLEIYAAHAFDHAEQIRQARLGA
ncbi:MAG: DinB family protein [Chloroflexota bacterium]